MATNSNGTNPWFGITMLLLGGIVGYGIAIAFGEVDLSDPIAANKDAPSQPTVQQQPEANLEALPPFDIKNDYYRGEKDAKIVLIEYSDFQCPYCTRHHDTMQQILDKYEGNVAWVLRHYPLSSMHPNAQPAAEAVECAGSIGGNDAFWQLTDLLFESGVLPDNFIAQVESIGIDSEEFQNCMDSGTFTEKVLNHLTDGTEAGVRGTPGTFVINTDSDEIKYVSGAQPIANFSSIIDEMLNN